MVVLRYNTLHVFPLATLAGLTHVRGLRTIRWYLVANDCFLVDNMETTFWIPAEDVREIGSNNSFSKRCLECVVST